MRRDFFHKDYYEILGVAREASPDEIKKAYRQLALQFHPDRNPGNTMAEERFKEISEAYGVLVDLEKRQRYDSIRQTGFSPGSSPGFGYTQEEIFRDIFNNPMASDVFSELGREFARMGVQFDERFFDRLFFGGRGIVFGGIFFGGPGGSPFGPIDPHQQTPKNTAEAFIPFLEKFIIPKRMNVTLRGRFFSWLGRKILGLGLKKIIRGTSGFNPMGSLDVTFTLPLNRDEVQAATAKEVSFFRNGKTERLLVKIPAGIEDGTMLRLRGKGKSSAEKAGDLYLKVQLK
ncbi:MAG: DnaJ domain-containing protein [Proteobacteria bacterium]|nr:DnaJ domain-containing protein [Pseudomonadota bacterium]